MKKKYVISTTIIVVSLIVVWYVFSPNSKSVYREEGYNGINGTTMNKRVSRFYAWFLLKDNEWLGV